VTFCSVPLTAWMAYSFVVQMKRQLLRGRTWRTAGNADRLLLVWVAVLIRLVHRRVRSKLPELEPDPV